MKCPICGKAVERSHREYPFCSGRCRRIDLGNWASGKYVISTPIAQSNSSEEDADEE